MTFRSATNQLQLRFRALRLTSGKWQAFVLLGPAVFYLFAWMIVPLAITLYYSFRKYNLIQPFTSGFAGIANYRQIIDDPNFFSALLNTLVLVGSCLFLTVLLGLAIAVLFNNENIFGRNVTRTLAASPFFIMPVVSGLIWKDLMLNPSFGVLAALQRALGVEPVAFLSTAPLATIIMIVTWEWTPFAMLVLLASLSGIADDIKEAAYLDGANAWQTFRHIVLPQLARPLYAVVMLESIFFLVIFGQIYVTTSGGPGVSSTNLPYYIYLQAFSSYNIGTASAAGVFAIILANIVAIFLVRMIHSNIQESH